MKAVFKFLKDNILLLIGGVILIFSLLSYVKQLLLGIVSDKNPYQDFEGNVSPDYSKGISKSQANIYAMQLLDAFNSTEPFFGTDEKMVYKVFSVITPNDFKKIYLEFGQRDYNGHGSPPQGVFRHLDNYDKRHLVYWLMSEIHPEEDRNLYLLVKKIVTDSGFIF